MAEWNLWCEDTSSKYGNPITFLFPGRGRHEDEELSVTLAPAGLQKQSPSVSLLCGLYGSMVRRILSTVASKQ